jgi:hypothetical protein
MACLGGRLAKGCGRMLAYDHHAAEVPRRQAQLFHQARSSRRMSWQGR